jgi:hypothetical protein
MLDGQPDTCLRQMDLLKLSSVSSPQRLCEAKADEVGICVYRILPFRIEK